MKKTINGFTIVELLLVITIIGILSTVAYVSFSKVQSSARDNQRATQIEVISQALEKYFQKNGEYPDCTVITAEPATTVTSNTLKGMDSTVLTAPQVSAGVNSIDSCTADPTASSFSYIPENGGYTLKYLQESTGQIVTKISLHASFTAISDNFNRTGTTLGTTTTGGKTWTPLVGTWSTNGLYGVTSSTDSSNPVAVVDYGYSDIDAYINTSSAGGGDSLVIRATNASNYIRARYYHTLVTTTIPGYCTIGSWVYTGQVYTENWAPGSVIPSDKVGGNCLPYDEWPNFNGNGAAQYKTVVTTTPVTCDYPYVNVCYWGDKYWRSVVDTPESTTYTQHYYIYLEKMVNGVFTTLYVGEIGSGITSLRIRALSSTISLYLNGSATATTTVTDSFNSTATKHGIGRGNAGNYTTSALDNFNLTKLIGN